MSDYVTLIGAEQVQNSGRIISQAADTMIRAANQIDDSVNRMTRLLEDFGYKIDALIVAIEKEKRP